MRSFKGLLISMYLVASTLAATDIPKFSAAEQEVLKISQARRDASNTRDLVSSARYVAENCLFSSDGGVLQTKSQYYEYFAKLPVEYDHSVNPRDFVVHVHGDAAVINFRTTTHERFGDNDIISEQRRTETWFKQNGTWLLIALQWDNLPVNFRTAVAVDTTRYKDYVGQYEWRPNGDIETVDFKDGKLWSYLGKDVDEYLPAGTDSFFIREGDLATFTFSRDAQGQVTGYVYHRIDGQEIQVKKLK